MREVRLGTGQDPGGRADVETMEECRLLACSSWIAQPDFIENPGHQSRDGPTHSELGPSTTKLLKKMHHRLTQGPVWCGYFLNDVLSSQMILTCVTDKTSQHQHAIYLGRESIAARVWGSWSHLVSPQSGHRDAKADGQFTFSFLFSLIPQSVEQCTLHSG